MTELQERAKFATEMLAKAVAEALERKRRLGQYAVVWRDGKLCRLSTTELQLPQNEK